VQQYLCALNIESFCPKPRQTSFLKYLLDLKKIMRNNTPVTNQEYVLNDTETIVSKTDLKGNITYVNQDFIRISGFSEQELLGAPQNLVRHPDMPEEAFADFWATIKKGKPWTGLVKNRSKNGDFYWVEANAAPLIHDHQIIGYTSIRIKPAREKIIVAEAAYRAIKQGDTSLEIVEGVARQRSTFSWFKLLPELTLASRMSAFIIAVVVLFACIALSAFLMPTTPASASYMQTMLGFSVFGMLLAGYCGWCLYINTIPPLNNIMHDIREMSEGNLAEHIHTHGDDEIGQTMQALRVLQTNLKLLIGQIKESTGQVHLGANEIAAGNADLSERTESQASSLEETATSMEELTSAVRQNSDNSQEANQLVMSTSQFAEKGGETVAKVVHTMNSISESSQRISDIVGVIDGIAFQTNILALNAAVEAARAGEQGRGFAVVASEVRNLAQRSATAAKEIKHLIDNSTDIVTVGNSLVHEAGHVIHEVVEGIRQAAAIMHDITQASLEQSTGIEQVNQAVIQMDQMTQQNSVMVEEAASSSDSLRHQAETLRGLVESFKLVNSGSHVSTNIQQMRAAKPAKSVRQATLTDIRTQRQKATSARLR